MEKRKGGRIEESDEEKWVHDASVDYKGRIPLRASTGVWKASLFVLGKIIVDLSSLSLFIYTIVILFQFKFATTEKLIR